MCDCHGSHEVLCGLNIGPLPGALPALDIEQDKPPEPEALVHVVALDPANVWPARVEARNSEPAKRDVRDRGGRQVVEDTHDLSAIQPHGHRECRADRKRDGPEVRQARRHLLPPLSSIMRQQSRGARHVLQRGCLELRVRTSIVTAVGLPEPLCIHTYHHKYTYIISQIYHKYVCVYQPLLCTHTCLCPCERSHLEPTLCIHTYIHKYTYIIISYHKYICVSTLAVHSHACRIN